MDEKQTQGMPIYFQMALAHNADAMQAFLRLDDKRQDEIINQARNVSTKREIQQIVDGLPMKHSF